MSVLIRGAASFEDPERPLDILLDGERIAEIGTDLAASPEATVVDARGLLVLPGLIDVHNHPIHDETFATVGDAAVFGGVTTICHQLYPAPEESYAAAVERMRDEAGEGAADYAAHVRWVPAHAAREDLRAARAAGAASSKAFLAHPDKTVQADLGQLTLAFQQAADAGLPLLVHAELGSVVDELERAGHADLTTHEGLHRHRSADNEAAAVTAAAVIAKRLDAHLYVVHVSCRQALDACLRARHDGVRVTIETCPHYLYLTHEDAPAGGRGFVLPPLREAADVAALRAALAAGEIDTVGSDHCGHADHAKDPDSIAASKAGLPGIEMLVPLLLSAALGDDAWLPRTRVVDVLARTPAAVFGLSGKGRITPGYDADLVLVDPGAVRTVSHDELHDAASYSPYEGMRLHGAIRSVWRRGQEVVRDGAPLAGGGGRFIPRADGRGTPS